MTATHCRNTPKGLLRTNKSPTFTKVKVCKHNQENKDLKVLKAEGKMAL